MPNKSIKIVLSGGGTAGHVLPHFVLLAHYKKMGWDLVYFGTSGIEKKLVEDEGIRFRQIRAGKLRRHFSWQNFLDLVWVLVGIVQSFFLLLQERPQLIFTKGGYVSVPVAVAGYLLRIPVLTHESDLSPGLANKIIARFSRKIFCAFPDTVSKLPKGKAEYVGLPIRMELSQGKAEHALSICGFSSEDQRPVVLIIGGSQGASGINRAIEAALPRLLEKFRLIHLTGRGKKTEGSGNGYFQAEYMNQDLKHLLALCDLVICRAGANTIFEMLALRKPMLLIPLEYATRGDQMQNAQSFQKRNWGQILREQDLSPDRIIENLLALQAKAADIRRAMEEAPANESAESIFRTLQSIVLEETQA